MQFAAPEGLVTRRMSICGKNGFRRGQCRAAHPIVVHCTVMLRERTLLLGLKVCRRDSHNLCDSAVAHDADSSVSRSEQQKIWQAVGFTAEPFPAIRKVSFRSRLALHHASVRRHGKYINDAYRRIFLKYTSIRPEVVVMTTDDVHRTWQRLLRNS